jgi:hypothetical protein
MPTLPIPLFTRSYKNADENILVDDAAVQYNGFIDELEGLNIRPGEVLAVNTAKRNDGLFMWPDKNFIISVNEGSVILHTVSGETLVTAYSGGSVTFSGNIVSFCNSGTNVFMAGGGKINYVNAVGTVTELADTDAPDNVTHVAFLDGYILAINGDGKLYWSNIPTNTDWSSLDFASAEGNPDNTKSLHVVQRQIYILGTVSTEIWENDGTTPFSRIPGGLIEIGCAAKYSPIKRGNTLMWLSHTREFVQFTGTDVEFISSRYNKEIARFSEVSDCIGGLIHHEGQEFCVFHFPSEQRTLVYNPALEDWSEWGNWDSSGMRWLPYDFRSTAYDLNTGKTFIGKELAACIACLDSDSRVDLVTAVTTRPFKFLRRTGHIDNGTTKKKRVESLRFKAKRGTGISSGTPMLMLRYRNNSSNTWSNIREISLGDIGETEHIIKLHRLGIYESRQYEISATDNVPVILSNAEADITVLR